MITIASSCSPPNEAPHCEFGSCSPPSEVWDCLLVEPQGPISVTPDAGVSVFFRVTDCMGAPLNHTLDTSNFTLTENGMSLSSESQHYIAPSGRRLHSDVLLLLDVSQSIYGNLHHLTEAAKAFVKATIPARENHSHGSVFVSIYTFDGLKTLKTLSAPSTDITELSGKLDLIATEESCKDNGHCRDPSTNLNGSVINALSVLDSLASQEKAKSTDSLIESSLVVFTDGADQANWNTKDEALSALSESGVHAFAVGLRGDDLDEGALSNFGPDGVFFADDVDSLTKAFSEIGQNVEAIANSYYILQYCSPKRNGTGHTLGITANLDGLSGSFSGQFSVNNWSGLPCVADPKPD